MLDSTQMMLTAVIGLLLVYCFYREREHNRHIEEHAKERRDLLDRIQAPNFNQYTAKVIAEKKVEQSPEEPKAYEDYIS